MATVRKLRPTRKGPVYVVVGDGATRRELARFVGATAYAQATRHKNMVNARAARRRR